MKKIHKKYNLAVKTGGDFVVEVENTRKIHFFRGDCKKQNLKDIWKSHKAYRFRNAFRLKRLPSICRECGLYISVTDAFTREKLLHYKPLDGLYYNV